MNYEYKISCISMIINKHLLITTNTINTPTISYTTTTYTTYNITTAATTTPTCTKMTWILMEKMTFLWIALLLKIGGRLNVGAISALLSIVWHKWVIRNIASLINHPVTVYWHRLTIHCAVLSIQSAIRDNYKMADFKA